MRALHPNALLLVHPECVPEVVAQADYVGSTSGIYNFALESANREFIIGTEISIAEHLQYAAPDKKFLPLSKKLMCHNMKATTLMDLYRCLNNNGGDEQRPAAPMPPAGGDEIILDSELIAKARVCIDEMIRLGGK